MRAVVDDVDALAVALRSALGAHVAAVAALARLTAVTRLEAAPAVARVARGVDTFAVAFVEAAEAFAVALHARELSVAFAPAAAAMVAVPVEVYTVAVTEIGRAHV